MVTNNIKQNSKIKSLERQIKGYRILCELADVPQIFIDNPTMIIQDN